MSLNSQVLPSMQRVALQCGVDRFNLLNNQSIIKAVAAQISSGRLRVCDQNWRDIEFDTGSVTSEATDPADSAPPFPLQERVAKIVTQSASQADPATFEDPLNLPEQVQALASAAAQGVPFCPE